MPGTILLVEDEAALRMTLGDRLRKEGYTVDYAGDGEEGLKALVSAPAHLVISDFNMPKLDGLGFLRAIRSHEPIRKTAFIMLTGRADKELVQRAMQYGVNNYVTKPFSPATLRGKIEEVFGPLT